MSTFQHLMIVLEIFRLNSIIFDELQEAYWDIASALSEADGIDYTDPEEVSTSMDKRCCMI